MHLSGVTRSLVTHDLQQGLPMDLEKLHQEKAISHPVTRHHFVASLFQSSCCEKQGNLKQTAAFQVHNYTNNAAPSTVLTGLTVFLDIAILTTIYLRPVSAPPTTTTILLDTS